MVPKIERVTDSVTLGEAPHWDVSTQSLYYVDIMGRTIHRYHPSTNTNTKASVGAKQVSFIIPIDGEKDHFVISLGKEITKIFWNGETENIEIVEKIAQVEDDSDFLYNRFNDGKCDPSGRLWAGTLNIKTASPLVFAPKGSLYSFDPDKTVKTHLSGLRISNGIAFDPKREKMYFIDSGKGTVDQYDFDIGKSEISHGVPIFTLSKHKIDGLADGMTIDSDGNLWVAIFNGGKVIKIDPKKPETLLGGVQLPVTQVTSVVFGGSALDELYVTTGAYEIFDGDELSQPENGAVYKISRLGAKGMPGMNIRLTNL